MVFKFGRVSNEICIIQKEFIVVVYFEIFKLFYFKLVHGSIKIKINNQSTLAPYVYITLKYKNFLNIFPSLKKKLLIFKPI